MDAVERVERFVDGRLGILDIWKNDLDFSKDLSTLLSLARSNGWQDIASAPKDGTHFFAWCPSVGLVLMRRNGNESETWSLFGNAKNPEPTAWCSLLEPPLDRLRGSEE